MKLRKRWPAQAFHSRHHNAKERHIRSNSGGGKSSNNTGNPTLEEHQAEKGVSGNAIRGARKVDAEPSRTSQRKHQNS